MPPDMTQAMVDLDEAVAAAEDDATRAGIIRRAADLGLAARIPAGWNPDGTLADAEPAVETLGATGPCTRSFVLDDISIRADGTGRTVVAYAAVFNQRAEVRDQDGHYTETLDPALFNKTISERGSRFSCFYNHGMTIYGTPSERYSMPLGTPEEVRADHKGLLTVTRYSKTDLADEVLENIRNGSIRGQSFSGKFITSKRSRGRAGQLDAIHRTECALAEYGPTPRPLYEGAAIVGVRMDELVDTMRALTDTQRAELHTLLDTSRTIGAPSLPADAADGTAAGTPTPDHVHAGPTKDQRQRRVRVLAITAPKGPAA